MNIDVGYLIGILTRCKVNLQTEPFAELIKELDNLIKSLKEQASTNNTIQ